MSALHQAAYKARRRTTDLEGWCSDRREVQATFRGRHPQKKSTWNAVYKAVRSGRLVRPENCERCGTQCKPQASHDDYAKQLEVEWLCQPCHTAKDVLLRRES